MDDLPNNRPIDIVLLRDLIVKTFNREELEVLYFDLEPRNPEINSSSFSFYPRLVQEVLLSFQRKGRLGEVVQRCMADRNGVDWTAIYATDPKIPGGQRIAALAEFLKLPAVVGYAAAFDERFQDFEESLIRAKDYKDLHDELHRMMFVYLDGILRSASKKVVIDTLVLQEKQLQLSLLDLRDITQRPTFNPKEKEPLLLQVGRTHTALVSAMETSDTARLKSEIKALASYVDLELTRVNESLKNEAKRLQNRASLKDTLENLKGVVAQNTQDVRLLVQFDRGISGVDEARKKLYELITAHDLLQKVHEELVLIRQTPGDLMNASMPFWGRLSGYCKEVGDVGLSDPSLNEMIDKHKRAGDVLTQSIAQQNAGRIQPEFRSYSDAAEMLFYAVDAALTRYLNRLVSELLPLLKSVRETIHGRVN